MQSCEVEIFDQKIKVSTDRDPVYVKNVARFVNERLEKLEKAAPRISTLNKTLLVCLNIADELFRCRENVENRYGLLEDQVNQLLELVSEQIPQEVLSEEKRKMSV